MSHWSCLGDLMMDLVGAFETSWTSLRDVHPYSMYIPNMILIAGTPFSTAPVHVHSPVLLLYIT